MKTLEEIVTENIIKSIEDNLLTEANKLEKLRRLGKLASGENAERMSNIGRNTKEFLDKNLHDIRSNTQKSRRGVKKGSDRPISNIDGPLEFREKHYKGKYKKHYEPTNLNLSHGFGLPKKDSIKKIEAVRKTVRQEMLTVNDILGRTYGIIQEQAENIGVDERLQWLTNRDMRKKLFEESPKCYMVIRTAYGNDIPLVPICNRMALDNPKLILGAITVAKSFLGDERVEQDHLTDLINKLTMLIGGKEGQ